MRIGLITAAGTVALASAGIAFAAPEPAAAAPARASPARPESLPAPQLKFTGTENYSANGKAFVRYRFDITNKARLPADLFAPAPDLPPCGINRNASRTWVDFFDDGGKRLYGFCALTSPADLAKIWFALEEGVAPPPKVYVEFLDRSTGMRLKSNLAPIAATGADAARGSKP